MNLEIKIISKTLMTKISHISWGGLRQRGITTKAFTVLIFEEFNEINFKREFSLITIKMTLLQEFQNLNNISISASSQL